MNMRHAKEIASWAQSNPNLPAHKQFNMYGTQLNVGKYNYNAHGMQCMKFLRLNLQNPSQKLHKNLFDFEKTQILQKSQKLRFQRMKCMKMRESKLTQ